MLLKAKAIVVVSCIVVLLGGVLPFAIHAFVQSAHNSAISRKQIKPSFDNVVLHWSEYFHSDIIGSPDIANGKTVFGDIWTKIDQSGRPILFHALYRFKDGVFYQELLVDKNLTVRVSSQADYSSPELCHNLIHVTTTQDIQARSPVFEDATSLAHKGFTFRKGGLTQATPIATNQFNLAPIQTYPANAGVVQWISAVAAQTGRTIYHYDITKDGFVAVYHGTAFNSKGKVISDFWESSSSLFVLQPAKIPASVFQLTSKTIHGCNVTQQVAQLKHAINSHPERAVVIRPNTIEGNDTWCLDGNRVNLTQGGSIIGNICRFIISDTAPACQSYSDHQCWDVYSQTEVDKAPRSPYLVYASADAWDWCNSDPNTWEMGGYNEPYSPKLNTPISGGSYIGHYLTCSGDHHYQTEGGYFLKWSSWNDPWQGNTIYDYVAPSCNGC